MSKDDCTRRPGDWDLCFYCKSPCPDTDPRSGVYLVCESCKPRAIHEEEHGEFVAGCPFCLDDLDKSSNRVN